MSRLLGNIKRAKPKNASSEVAAQLYPVGTRSDCPLPSTGKYWGWRHGGWERVMVEELPRGGGTGTLVFAPLNRTAWRLALANCQAFWGPVKAWGSEPPWVPAAWLKAVGVTPPPTYRKPAGQARPSFGAPFSTKALR